MKEYQDIIDNIIEQHLNVEKNDFDFDKYTQVVTEKHQAESDFVEVMKELN
jgi:hypothetical protein